MKRCIQNFLFLLFLKWFFLIHDCNLIQKCLVYFILVRDMQSETNKNYPVSFSIIFWSMLFLYSTAISVFYLSPTLLHWLLLLENIDSIFYYCLWMSGIKTKMLFIIFWRLFGGLLLSLIAFSFYGTIKCIFVWFLVYYFLWSIIWNVKKFMSVLSILSFNMPWPCVSIA